MSAFEHTRPATSPNELNIERLIAAPPETVFDYWIKPELFAAWFGPENSEIPEYEIDPKVGGSWTITLLTDDCAQHKVSGVWRAIEPVSRLAFTWAWHDEQGERGHETEVVVTLEPAPGGTKLRLLQREFESAELTERHGFGWNSSFNCLEAVLDNKA